MNTMHTKTRVRVACLAALALSVVGCALPALSPAPTGTSVATGAAAAHSANLHVQLNLGQRIQVTGREVTRVHAELKMAGQVFNSEASGAAMAAGLDFPVLPAGDGILMVEAFVGDRMVGQGITGVPLLIGHRTSIAVQIPLDSTGTTDMGVISPLDFLAATTSISTPDATESMAPTPDPSQTPYATPTPGPTPAPYVAPTPAPDAPMIDSVFQSHYFPLITGASWTYRMDASSSISNYQQTVQRDVANFNAGLATFRNTVTTTGATTSPTMSYETATASMLFNDLIYRGQETLTVTGTASQALHYTSAKGPTDIWFVSGIGPVQIITLGFSGPESQVPAVYRSMLTSYTTP